MYELTYFLAGLFIGAPVCFFIMYLWHQYKLYKVIYNNLPILHALMEERRKSNAEMEKMLKTAAGWGTVGMPGTKQ